MTAAAAALGHAHGRALAGFAERGPQVEAVADQARRVGGCESPVRLRGRVHILDRASGELTEIWSSEGLPDGVAHARCGNRRASRCQPCAALYQRDAWHVIAAGLSGGKGVPPAVAGHPAVFATLTAPGFGAVHTPGPGRCRSRRGLRHRRCAHGRPVACTVRHHPDDPVLGRPLCWGCFDYSGAVVWNAHVPELWRRTMTQVRRSLAVRLGTAVKALPRRVTLRYVKVGEYQRRGLLHLHAVIRVDGPPDPCGRPTPPPPEITADLLADAVRDAAARVRVPRPPTLARPTPGADQAAAAEGTDAADHGRRGARRGPPPPPPPPSPEGSRLPAVPLPAVPLATTLADIRWGVQTDIRPLDPDDRPKAAGYLAKYATKHTEAAGGRDRRVRTVEDLASPAVNGHAHRLMLASWLLGAAGVLPGGRRWAHQFGWGGHFLTKSPRWSVTFTQLRAARRVWTAETEHSSSQPAADDGGDQVGAWQRVGHGWRLESDGLLAAAVRRRQRAARQAARDARTPPAGLLERAV